MTEQRRLSDTIRVVGFDPSLRNWGVAKGVFVPTDGTLMIDSLDVIKPLLSQGKQVRQNSMDLESAEQLAKAAMAYAKDAQAIFVEIPTGSQKARGSLGSGVCIGILGALRAMGIPFYEVTPNQVKLVSVGNRAATKAEMIKWAMDKHPEGGWPMQTQKGVVSVVAGTAEHMADAIAAIYAGMDTKDFKQMLSFLTR